MRQHVSIFIHCRESAGIIQDNLRTNIIGRETVILERTASTMDIAKKMLKEGAIEGTIIFVEEDGQGKSGSARKGKVCY